jgi:prephenate dehydrogenase
VGITPILNAKYLHSDVFGIAAAQPDLFHGGMFGIVTLANTGASALQAATELVQLMGADPFFADIHEMDGLMAATHFLPQFMSTALLNVTIDQPGWHEARKVAGRAFAEISGPAAHLDEMESLVAAAVLNRDNILRKLDDAILALQLLRADIEQGNQEGLKTKISLAKAGIHQWWQERGQGDWLAEELPKIDSVPTSSEVMGSLLGFGLGRKKKKDR